MRKGGDAFKVQACGAVCFPNASPNFQGAIVDRNSCRSLATSDARFVKTNLASKAGSVGLETQSSTLEDGYEHCYAQEQKDDDKTCCSEDSALLIMLRQRRECW
jgi:hypothetical protein